MAGKLRGPVEAPERMLLARALLIAVIVATQASYLQAKEQTPSVISPLRSAPAAYAKLARMAVSSSGEAPTHGLPTDAVTLKPTGSFREPKAAVTFLQGFDKQLGLSEEMAKEKRELMSESSHAFFRASPALFYHDLQSTFLESSRLLPEPAPRVAIVGDAHILNAGSFRGPQGVAVWGLNDFDQSEIGSPEWDLERMGVSLYVAGRSGGLSSEESLALVHEMGASYLENLGTSGPAFLGHGETRGKIAELVEKAGSKDQEKFLSKWTAPGGKTLLRGEDLEDPADPKRGAEVRHAVEAAFPDLSLLDLASKPHSGGSTRGLERYYVLVEDDRPEPWILEVKAVLPTPVQIPDGDLSRGDGAKVLGFQKLMGSPVDSRHKSFKLGDIAFFTREREREKDSLKDKVKNLGEIAAPLGKVLARAHNASGADLKSWVDGREEALLANLETFSKTYARQVESDFREFTAQ